MPSEERSQEQEPVTRPRAVVLSGSIGLGHEMLVRSCSAFLEGSGWQVRSIDCMRQLGRHCGAAGQRLFNRMVCALPGLYDGLHFSHLRTGSPLARAMDSGARARLVPALRAELDASPVDLVLSVFATGASAAAALKHEVPARRTVVLCTDVTLHRLWVAEGTDLFLATSGAAAASVLRYLPRAKVAVVPPPVRPAFYAVPDQGAARSALGLPPDVRCVLAIDSGWGFGSLVEGVEAMAAAGIHVLAVAGRRQDVERRFRGLASASPYVHAFGFVDDVPLLMAAADAVMSLPGATTSAEARVVGRPLLLLDLMPGHGRENVIHELERGDARVCGPSAADMVAAASALLDAGLPRPLPVPRWEPAFAAALSEIGFDVDVAVAGPSLAVGSPAPLSRTDGTGRDHRGGYVGDGMPGRPDLAAGPRHQEPPERDGAPLTPRPMAGAR
jgi:processive 1,2-diacylglycerol beta-glucosyltransferase